MKYSYAARLNHPSIFMISTADTFRTGTNKQLHLFLSSFLYTTGNSCPRLVVCIQYEY